MDSKILFHESVSLIIKADKNINWDLVKLTTPVGVKIIDGEFVASVYNTTDSEFVGMLSSKVLVNDCIEVSAIKDGFVYGLEIEGMSVGDKIIAGNGVFIKAVGNNSIAEVIAVKENNYCLVRGLRTQAGGGGGGAVNSVNGMDGDVVIEAKNLNANIVGNPALLQSEYNSAMYEAVRDANNKADAVENELYTKQDKEDDALSTTSKNIVGAINEIKASSSLGETTECTLASGFNIYNKLLATKKNGFVTVRVGIEINAQIAVQTRKLFFTVPALYRPADKYYYPANVSGSGTGPIIPVTLEIEPNGFVYLFTAAVLEEYKYIYATFIYPVL